MSKNIFELEAHIISLEREIISMKKTIDHHQKCIESRSELSIQSANTCHEYYSANKSDISELRGILEIIVEKMFPENQKYQDAIERVLKTHLHKE